MAIPAARQSMTSPLRARLCVRAAGWLSLLLYLAAPAAWSQTLAPGMYHLGTVSVGGGVYEWRYKFVPGAQMPAGNYFEVTGLYDVVASGGTSIQNFVVSHTATTFRITWAGPGVRPPACQNCPEPGAWFYYRSSSAAAKSVNWQRSDVAAENGLVDGAAAAPDIPATVTAWDNSMSFGSLAPLEGTFKSPVRKIANASPASGWNATASAHPTIAAIANYDVGYLQISTPKRLNLSLRMGGHLQRCTATGGSFTGTDTRKGSGRYELSTQWKAAFYGAFLLPGGTPFVSPTSGQPTTYNTWTNWSPSGNDPAAEGGWLWPSTTDAWTGGTPAAAYTQVTGLDLVVERNQYEDSSVGNAAALCLLTSVLRRGQQDVQGNYRQIITIDLTYAE